MEVYFLKSATCLAILLLFYKFLLEREDMHVFKRFYLLTAVWISFILPFITFTSYVEVPAESIVMTSAKASGLPFPPASESGTPLWQIIFWSIYGAGVLFFGGKFFLNLKELVLKIKNNIRLTELGSTKVLLKEDVVPHTFLDYIFLNKWKYEENKIPKEVFEHEQAHVDQKHSYDILFMELLQVVFWFHPLLYLTKNAIKLNHEFLADKMVLKKGTATAEYQQMLLAFSSGASHGSLAHPINYSFIKKRFTVMKKQTSKSAVWVRSLLILPLAAVLLYGFSTKEVVTKPQFSEPSQLTRENLQEKATPEMVKWYNALAKQINSPAKPIFKSEDVTKLENIYTMMSPEQKKMAEPFPKRPIERVYTNKIVQEKLTPEMIEEYNKLAKYYNSQPEDHIIRMEEILRMRYIHSLMTEEQKTKAEPLPAIYPPPPPPPPVPSAPPIPAVPPVDGVHPEVPEPPVPPAPKHSDMKVPGPPPPPPAPVEHMKELAAKGARFFISGKDEISAEEAIKFVRNNKNISIEVVDNDSEITVFISEAKD